MTQRYCASGLIPQFFYVLQSFIVGSKRDSYITLQVINVVSRPSASLPLRLCNPTGIWAKALVSNGPVDTQLK